MREPSDQEKRDYEIKINSLISAAEQMRERIYNEMMYVTSQVFDPNDPVPRTANSLLLDYCDEHPIPDDAPWQEKAMRWMSQYVNMEMMLDIERRHGKYLGGNSCEDKT